MTENGTEHLELETISALLDEPDADHRATAHLESCESCSRELDRLRRMRMALSGLGDIEPPAGEWARIESRLPGGKPTVVSSRRLGWLRDWPAQAAAAMLVFGGGIWAGLSFAGPDAPDVSLPSEVPAAQSAGVPAAQAEADEGYLAAVADLQRLRTQPVPSAAVVGDPVAGAERLARLDALIQASREALVAAPADPAVNNLLFELIEERDVLTQSLGSAAYLAGLDYR